LLAQNQQMQQDMATYQQQNDALLAQQQQLQRERDAVALQNQQMQQNLSTLQSGYQQLNGQNQALQAEFAADEQMDTTNLAVAFWVGAAVLLVVSAVIVTTVASSRASPGTAQASAVLPEPSALEADPWISREYRDRAIQKARLIEQWERRSLQISQSPHAAPVMSNQRRVKQNTA
jgi:chromosome segregation ATPase